MVVSVSVRQEVEVHGTHESVREMIESGDEGSGTSSDMLSRASTSNASGSKNRQLYAHPPQSRTLAG
jgi:hypothetical protein